MLVKTVTTVVATNSIGQPVDAIPVRQAVAGETDIVGRPVDVITVEESDTGVPVRYVTGKAVQNSAGQWVDTIAVQGGGVPSLASMERMGVVGHSIVRQQLLEWGPDVGQMSFATCAWAHFAAMLSGGTFYIDPFAVEGYSGARADEVQAQILPPGSITSLGQSGAKVSVPYGIRSTGVQRVLVMALTNDVQYEGAQQATTNPSPTPAISRLRALWAYLRSIGIEPVNVSLLPRGDEYAAAMPAWVAAEAAAATTDGVLNINVYTPCASGTAWKTGYNHKNGVVDPAFGLHPGADGCMLGIAPAVAAAITSTKTKTPELVSATKAELVRGTQSLLVDVLLNGSAQPYWDGLFSSAGNWPIGFESAASTRTVAADGIAHYGNRFRVACAAQASEFYSDTRKTVPLVAGKKYALIGRVKFDAGAARPTPSNAADSFAISMRDAALNVFALFQSGSVDAYSTQGASVPEGSFCFPFFSPITGNAMMLFEQRTQPASAGSEMDLAQFQIIELP